MAVVINTNVDSLKIQTLLTNSTNKMSQSMQRMSSGLKILSAKDDAAGSVISSRMIVQLNGNKIAQNNVQNGNAMLSTAEGNIDVVLDNVSRIRDLTLQAKNGTYSKEEIQAMQDEVAERIAEIDRISNSSKYSQLELFANEELQKDGVFFQVGANASVDNIIEASAGIFQSIKFHDITGFTEKAEEVDTDDGNKLTAAPEPAETDNSYVEISKYEYEQLLANEETKDTVAHFKTYTDADGKEVAGDVYLKEVVTDDLDDLGLEAYEMPDEGVESYRQVTQEAEPALDLAADGVDYDDALGKLDAAIDNLTARKSQIGSAQNRLDSALATLTTQETNLSSAKSIITDTDVAEEASAFTQNQILQQVSTSLLAQANQAPSIALSLV